MSNSSSSSSRFNRRQVNGVPTRCWCGKKLTTYCSQTDENPFWRFYRCEIALQRKNEEHLFKWVDKALLDEIRMIDVKLMGFVDEVKEMKTEMLNKLDVQRKLVLDLEEDMKKKLKEEIKEEMKEEMMKADATIKEMGREMAKRVGITVLFVGALGWICGKIVMR